MSNIDRYDPHSKGSVTFNNFGWLVRYEDYKKLKAEIKVMIESRDELLEALKLSVETEIDEGYVFKDSIQRAEATKETMKGGETNQ